MTMEDLLNRIATGTTTERDADEVGRLIARHIEMKIFVYDMAQFCTNPVHRARATRLLASDGGEGQYVPSRQWRWLVGRKLSLGMVMDVSDSMATVLQGDDVMQVPLSKLLEEDYRSHDRHMASLSEALNSGDGAYRP
jgi:hypothetical protein